MVELREHRGKNVATGQEVYLGQYRIYVDGRAVGFVKDRPGATVSLVVRFGSIERAEIERQVRELLPTVAGVQQPPDVPDDIQTGEYIDDDYDN